MNDIYIAYDSFKYVSGSVKDTLTTALENVARNRDDARQPAALFELAVINISGYTDPYASSDKGLSYLRRSAALGHLPAQGLYFRVRNAVQHTDKEGKADDVQVLRWMEAAAAEGHAVATADLLSVDPDRAQRALKCYATKYGDAHSPSLVNSTIQAQYSFTNAPSDVKNESLPEMTMHTLAAIGDVAGMRTMVMSDRDSINRKDREGNTPLIVASRYRQHESVTELLKLGANPLVTNTFGENFLHYAWCFTKLELESVIQNLSQKALLFTQEAIGSKVKPSLDILPTCPGTALERAVMMNQHEAVKLFLLEMKHYTISNGATLRRALMLALRLHNVWMQHTLVAFIRERSPEREQSHLPLDRTLWDHKGSKRSFVDAVTVGYVSGPLFGLDVPLKWWRVCQLGKKHYSAIQESMKFVLWTITRIGRREKLVDQAICLALDEQLDDSLKVLLDVKAMVTNGTEHRLESLQPLAWWGKPTLRNHWLSELLLTETEWEILERPAVEVNFADQIFFDIRIGTLLHQTILCGHRAMFVLLTDYFRADLALPASASVADIGTDQIRQLNVYALLAQSQHTDLWFARQFWKHRIPVSLPFDSIGPQKWNHLPPLYHALYKDKRAYSLWLMRHGASLEEHTQRGGPGVLEALMSSDVLCVNLSEFLFPCGNVGGAFEYLPEELKAAHGFEVFKMLYRRTNLRRVKSTDEDAERLLMCLKYLFRAYPDVPDCRWMSRPLLPTPLLSSPSIASITPWLSLHYRGASLLEESLTVYQGYWEPGKRPNPFFKATVEFFEEEARRRPRSHPFPRQSWLDVMIFGSPLDHLKMRSWRQTTLRTQHKYWPSLRIHFLAVIIWMVLLDYFVPRSLSRFFIYWWSIGPYKLGKNEPDADWLWQFLFKMYRAVYYGIGGLPFGAGAILLAGSHGVWLSILFSHI